MVPIPGSWELLLIVLVILLLFGAKKLPELALGSGRALRIFKAETKGLADDGGVHDDLKTAAEEIEGRPSAPEPQTGESIAGEQRDGTDS